MTSCSDQCPRAIIDIGISPARDMEPAKNAGQVSTGPPIRRDDERIYQPRHAGLIAAWVSLAFPLCSPKAPAQHAPLHLVSSPLPRR